MNKIRSVSIVGAGAMGAAYAAMFTDAQDFTVSFSATGERLAYLNKKNLQVNGRTYTIPAISPDKVDAPPDLILVALKHHHLETALDTIKTLCGEQTIILSVMNGLESEAIIGSVCGTEKVIFSVAVGIDAVREKERFTYANPGKIIFGKKPGSSIASHKLERLQEALNRAAIPNEIPDNIEQTLWWKFMINVGINQASAVLKAPYGVFQVSKDAMDLMLSLMQEVLDVAKPLGIGITQKDMDHWKTILTTLSPSGKTSMLQDIEAGRKTEVEIFAGKVVQLGEQLKVPTPVNQTLLRIIRCLETR